MLDISPLASVIATWLKSIGALWEGIAIELLEELAATALRVGQPRAVPQTAARLGRALRGLRDDLQNGGVEIEFSRSRWRRAITIKHAAGRGTQHLTDRPRPPNDEPAGIEFLSQRQLTAVLAEIRREQTSRLRPPAGLRCGDFAQAA